MVTTVKLVNICPCCTSSAWVPFITLLVSLIAVSVRSIALVVSLTILWVCAVVSLIASSARFTALVVSWAAFSVDAALA